MPRFGFHLRELRATLPAGATAPPLSAATLAVGPGVASAPATATSATSLASLGVPLESGEMVLLGGTLQVLVGGEHVVALGAGQHSVVQRGVVDLVLDPCLTGLLDR